MVARSLLAVPRLHLTALQRRWYEVKLCQEATKRTFEEKMFQDLDIKRCLETRPLVKDDILDRLKQIKFPIDRMKQS